MEIILVLTGILFLLAFVFFLIEFPYYLVGLFVFLHIYAFNLEIPGPLDFRGLISVILFMRLVVFDRNNLELIKKSLSNNFLILIFVFMFYNVLVDLFNDISLVVIFRSLLLNVITILLGFVTIINGYGKKTIVLAIFFTGVVATGDLVYSYYVRGDLMIRRMADVLFADFVPHRDIMNHNFFGQLCGYALITNLVLFISKQISKTIFITFLILFALGILISTSRMTFLSVTVTVVLILIVYRGLNIDFKKIFIIGTAGIISITIIIFSYSYILSAMNISSEFADQIYWRLVEEPLSFFGEDIQEYTWDNNKVQSSIRWRIAKTSRDVDVFLNQETSTILFGFGTGGYNKISELEFRGTAALKYAAHNFYTNLVVETGIIGLTLFLIFFLSLLISTIRLMRQFPGQFSFIYILLLMFVLTIGSEADLMGKVGYILYGAVIAEIIILTTTEGYPAELIDNSSSTSLIAKTIIH